MIKSVWIIDDNEINNFICENLFRAASISTEVKSFTEAADAIDSIQSEPLPELLLLDLNMPEMNGWQFLDKIQTIENIDFKRLNLFILTSSIARNDLEKAGEYALVKGFITKPLTQDTILSIGNEINLRTN